MIERIVRTGAASLWLAMAAFLSAGNAEARPRADNGCISGPLKSMSQLDDRIAACTVVIDSSRSPAQISKALFVRAQNLLDQKKCDLGIDDLNRAKAISPSRKDANYYNIHLWTSFYWQQCRGDFERGLAELNAAALILPRDPAVYNQRSNMLRDMGDYGNAMNDMNRALALVNNDPYRGSSYNNRALLWKSMGQYDRAVADFSLAIKFQPKRAKYYANRGEAFRLLGQLDRALQDQNRSIEMFNNEPGVALALQVRGDTLRYMGDYDRAFADYADALSSEPDFAPAYVGRGLTFERIGDYLRAKTDFQTALRVSENSGRGDNSKSARDTAEARLAALNSGAPQPIFIPTQQRATSTTSIPTIAVAAPVVAPAVAKASAVKEGRRAALIIGNSAYTSVPALANPQRDAEKLAAALRAIGFETVTLAQNSTRETMLDSLRTFAGVADKADWALVYYAGHGIEVNGVNYLVPVDAKIKSDRDITFEAMPLDQVLSAIDGARKLKLVVLDACRDNPFADRVTTDAPTTVAVAAPATETRSARTRSLGRGLGEVKVQGASLVVYAAKHGQTALDGEGENSPFAVAMVQRLATPGVEINKLFRLVRDDVMEATAGRQEPYTYGSLPGREDFFFVAR